MVCQWVRRVVIIVVVVIVVVKGTCSDATILAGLFRFFRILFAWLLLPFHTTILVPRFDLKEKVTIVIISLINFLLEINCVTQKSPISSFKNDGFKKII